MKKTLLLLPALMLAGCQMLNYQEPTGEDTAAVVFTGNEAAQRIQDAFRRRRGRVGVGRPGASAPGSTATTWTGWNIFPHSKWKSLKKCAKFVDVHKYVQCEIAI